MDLQNIFHEIEKVDPEVYDRLDSRRAAMKEFTRISGKIALAAIPFALGGMFKKAYSQTTSGTSVADVLKYALTLEYLESAYYIKGIATPGLIPTAGLGAITTIRDHEKEHVNFLQTVLSGLGGAPASPEFDFTAGGTFPTVFSDYNYFLAVAQTFEDTGVRAYKGQAANLSGNATVLTAALSIHSVEARHASHIRSMRRAIGQLGATAALKPWITLNQSGIATTAVNPSYAGEELIVQAGIDIAALDNIGANSASEAFDEPLSMDQVLPIAKLFIKP
ncbi:ferritin-like domain-containing protein [Chitinophaga silvatica]|uniref:Ferritin-like domain-containing protein n=1 Tax=Chitinophaga silvatica TaxID=2282649 RepID=A0A3E1YBP9_9BACT|nr:ferritin-like domain-containing protein [Chitinophaga silvatica]RFS23503.1 ferritin-like domain-containing protein [Chitinophaga silvatica]